jgi:hypothetical protein
MSPPWQCAFRFLRVHLKLWKNQVNLGRCKIFRCPRITGTLQRLLQTYKEYISANARPGAQPGE